MGFGKVGGEEEGACERVGVGGDVIVVVVGAVVVMVMVGAN